MNRRGCSHGTDATGSRAARCRVERVDGCSGRRPIVLPGPPETLPGGVSGIADPAAEHLAEARQDPRPAVDEQQPEDDQQDQGQLTHRGIVPDPRVA